MRLSNRAATTARLKIVEEASGARDTMAHRDLRGDSMPLPACAQAARHARRRAAPIVSDVMPCRQPRRADISCER